WSTRQRLCEKRTGPARLHVKDCFAVRGKGGAPTPICCDLLGSSSGEWHAPDLGSPGAVRIEVNPFPIGRPGRHIFVSLVGRNPPRPSSARIHDIHAPFAIIAKGIKGDPMSIGRPVRRPLEPSKLIG